MANDTGLEYYPRYLNIGDLAIDDYLITDDQDVNYIAPEDLDFGDLSEAVNFREMLQIATDSASADRPKREVLLGALESAEAEFDSYITKRYSTPLRTAQGYVPREAKAKVKLLFKYYLYTRRPSIPTTIETMYAQVIEWLINVSRGLATIPVLEITDDGSGGKDAKELESSNIGAVTGVVYRGTNLMGNHIGRTDRTRSNGWNGFNYPGD